MPFRLTTKNRVILLFLCLLALALSGCKESKAPEKPVVQETPARPPGCESCHPEVRLDPSHNLACTDCHGGNPKGATQELAHAGLISQPAHPDQMQKGCGGCHARQVAEAATSLHFTAKNEVNAVRTAFGAQAPLASLTQIPTHETIGSSLDLADDLLRRRCLRCHAYNSGDSYPETVRGTGCAACHLAYTNGTMTSHAFSKSPGDSQCLHCHYGNFVGADYYGRFEHDFNLEYRTPYRTDGSETRPYGVEFHQLAPDIHQQKGMACIDCHSGAELMGGHSGAGKKEKAVTCLGCHGWRTGLPIPLDNLQVEENRLVLFARLTGKKLVVPKLVHPAHKQYGKKAHCTVCHSQWSFNDQGTHLLRIDNPDHPAWSRLSVQGSREVEEQLDNPPGQGTSLRDKINEASSPSLWLKGYELRRWESPLIGIGTDGMLHIFRPILDLHLSMADANKKVLFDNVGVAPRQQRYLPYTPHTVGKAGAFFNERLTPNLPTEIQP
ncbi:MAG: hypothetical protein D9V46_02230 [Deltaproteobacteria bacterium]|uniref:hypothetical protein n=1 Tax=Hydrosulfovibrio ferrireducens TaxID=2934181 RepID=UPI0011F7C6F0|nr:MAG: hypothetical protein D9V46_02230 [Deltaproteobacteria bacterium]